MKKIYIDRTEYYYKIVDHSTTITEYYTTEFYTLTKDTVRKRKYMFIGPIVEAPVWKEEFVVGINIEDPKYSKEYVRGRISKAIERLIKDLNDEQEKLVRKSEIDRGEII